MRQATKDYFWNSTNQRNQRNSTNVKEPRTWVCSDLCVIQIMHEPLGPDSLVVAKINVQLCLDGIGYLHVPFTDWLGRELNVVLNVHWLHLTKKHVFLMSAFYFKFKNIVQGIRNTDK